MKLHFKSVSLVLGVSLLAFTAAADDSTTAPGSSMNQDSSGNPGDASLTSQQFVTDAATTDMKEIHFGELALQKSDNADVQSFAKHLVADHKKACKKLRAIAEREGLNFPDTNAVEASLMQGQEYNNNGWQQTNGYTSGSVPNAGHGITNLNYAANNPAMNTGDNSSGATNGYQSADVSRGGNVLPNQTNMVPDTSSTTGTNSYQAADVERGGHILTNLDNQAGQPAMNVHEMNLASLSGADFDRAYVAKMVKGHKKAIHEFETASATLTDTDLKKYADKTLPTLREHLRMAQQLQSEVGMPTDMNTASTSQK
jgi:predicted outer membrane protein